MSIVSSGFMAYNFDEENIVNVSTPRVLTATIGETNHSLS